ncbi:MAG: cell wall-active antibiotics response protein [Chlorobi bacterium]|nr:cell wall-active antibiotics response protein [Chlorobiota bacterium]
MEENNKPMDKKMLAGGLLILAGALLFLDTFDLVYFNIGHYIFSWKTLMIGVGVVMLSSPERKNTGYILIGLGVLFWLPSIFEYNIRLKQVFWPLILIAVGAIILSRRNVHGKYRQTHGNAKAWSGESRYVDMDYMDDLSILGGGNKRIQSKNFKGGKITAIFGGSEFDLKNAEISPEGCVIDVFTMFGGSKLIVPEDWQVKSDVFSMFGGFGDKRSLRPTDADASKTLMIKGFVMFGGIEIKNF